MEEVKISHRERVERAINGEVTDRIPVAMWRHFPVDDQNPETLAQAVLQFQLSYDFDLIKITPASSYCLKDWGVEDEWRGNIEGTRDYTKRVVHRPEDWETLEILDPNRGNLAEELIALHLITSHAGSQIPVLQTIFSPLAQAKNLAGGDELLLQMRSHPDAVHIGLRSITETTLRFLKACLPSGISGIFYAIQHAQTGLLTEEEYLVFGKPYDLAILGAAKDLWLNMVHLHGKNVMFDLVADYPVQVINWHDRESSPSLSDVLAVFPGAVCGGLSRWESMVLGSPLTIRTQAQDAITQTGGKRFILGTGCVLPIITPHGNILASRFAAEVQLIP